MRSIPRTIIASLALLQGAWAGNILSSDGFSSCKDGNSTVIVQRMDISFDRSSNNITFDVAGTSTVQQQVTAQLRVTAYGVEVYKDEFDPCDPGTRVEQLCPVPSGSFAAKGVQTIPAEFVAKIPSIAFTLPDIEADAQLTLKAAGSDTEVACLKAGVNNGNTVELPAVSYVAAAIAGAALAGSAASLALSSASGGSSGGSTSSPGFFDVMWWFQGLAMNGMHSVEYPKLYRSFTKNFAFSTGLVPLSSMQQSIDSLRRSTGGNLTENSFANLQNATLQFADGSTAKVDSTIVRRAYLFARQIQTSVDSSTSNATSEQGESTNKVVQGIQSYAEQLSVPKTNVFMTVLLVFAIVTAAIIVGILLFKAILEAWAIWGRFPKSLATFRKEYWRVIGQTLVSLVMLLYGIWTLYCVYQFTNGDSWVAQLLAGLTLAAFTGVLAFYVWRIWTVAHKLKKAEGDASALYEDKPTWKKYRIFYENYKKSYWWLFVPTIVYMFAKGCILAGADGHGLVQTGGQLIVEALMLVLLLFIRPFNRRSGNWINIIIQVVRVLSVVCILIFAQELGISKTTSTITGIALVAVQASLTGILALLILVNAIITCCKENPHRKRRKAAAKRAAEGMEGDAFLMTSAKAHQKGFSDASSVDYEEVRAQALARHELQRSNDSRERLVNNAATMGRSPYQPVGQHYDDPYEAYDHPATRQPTIPDVEYERFRPTPGHPDYR